MEFNIQIGVSQETQRVVTDKDTAVHLGSGEVTVLATPVMIGWMENAALNSVKHLLPSGYDTVGTAVNVSHLAATPVGMKVRIVTEVVEVNKNKILFKVKAYDEVDKIGYGTHERAIIETSKFLSKVKGKKQK